uniref:Major facilitator superfamily (MFS) profile domain-containing protein n=1 Tax=Clastoptera arizonana TaxID=38151 RepID=A0A1B6CTW4_9HEMI
MTLSAPSDIKKPIPPDGGWGWMIVLGFSLSNVICIPIIQGFGLLYRDLLKTLGLSATDMSLIINTNSSVGYILGLMNGPILRNFGYRKVAIFGGLILFLGNFLTSFADSFLKFILCYGIVSSLGFNFVMCSFMLAMNTYFVKKRSNATGIAMTITGLGPVVMPIVISMLIATYGVRGTSMLLAALSLHGVVGAMLLQPIKRHYKKEKEDVKENKEDQGEKVIADDVQSLFGEGEVALVPRKMSVTSDVRRSVDSTMYASRQSLRASREILKPDSTWWSSSRTSLNTAHVQTDPANNIEKGLRNSVEKEPGELNTLLKEEIKKTDESIQNSKNNQSQLEDTWQKKIVRFFDLDLLTDRGYVIINIGISIALTGEFNFSLMTPFIFGDRNYDIKSTAILMSIIATADIISRFFTPFIGNRLKWSAKNLYLLSLCLLMPTRFSLTLVSSYEATVVVAICLGIAKGIRTIYMGLVIPNYVPLEKLASAQGLQAVVNGLCLLTIGPIIGYVRDATGNYNYCIHIMNLLTFTTVVLWVSEMIYIKIKEKPELESS